MPHRAWRESGTAGGNKTHANPAHSGICQWRQPQCGARFSSLEPHARPGGVRYCQSAGRAKVSKCWVRQVCRARGYSFARGCSETVSTRLGHRILRVARDHSSQRPSLGTSVSAASRRGPRSARSAEMARVQVREWAGWAHVDDCRPARMA